MKQKLLIIFVAFVSFNGLSQITTDNKKIDFSLSFKIGINNSSLIINNNGFGDSVVDYGNKSNLTVGFEAEMILPFNKNKWSVITEPRLLSYYGEEIFASTGIAFGDLTGEVNYQSIEVPIGIKHYFNLNKKSKLFIMAAYVFDFEFSSSGITFFAQNRNINIRCF